MSFITAKWSGPLNDFFTAGGSPRRWWTAQMGTCFCCKFTTMPEICEQAEFGTSGSCKVSTVADHSMPDLNHMHRVIFLLHWFFFIFSFYPSVFCLWFDLLDEWGTVLLIMNRWKRPMYYFWADYYWKGTFVYISSSSRQYCVPFFPDSGLDKLLYKNSVKVPCLYLKIKVKSPFAEFLVFFPCYLSDMMNWWYMVGSYAHLMVPLWSIIIGTR